MRPGGDTPAYLQVCDLYTTAPLEALTSIKGIIYAGFTVPFCSVWAVSGGVGEWWVAIQIVLSSLGCVLVYDTGRRMFGTGPGMIAAGLMVVVLQVFRYDVVLLSESIFVFVVTLSVWALTRYRLDPTTTNRIVVWCCLGYLAITRPFGGPILFGWLLVDLVPEANPFRLGLFRSRRLTVGLLGAIPILMFALTPLHKVVRTTVTKFASGNIFAHAFPFTYPFPLQETGSFLTFVAFNLHHLLAIGLLRIGFFLSLYTPKASTAYTVVNYLTLGPAMLFGLLGMKRLATDRSAFAPILIIPLVMTSLMVGATFISYGGRFRAYVVPVLVLAAGYEIQQRWLRNRSPAGRPGSSD
jgi:4-amino-4-deoxy-L-arabinose transferase-like glycosyltransferase